jgi:uncharacterized protein (DUF4415 family)
VAKKSIGSSARGKRAKKSGRSTPGSRIDFSDIPELTEGQLGKMKRVGRPLLGGGKRQLIAIRIDPKVLEQLKAHANENGTGYQTLINEILGKYIKNRAA